MSENLTREGLIWNVFIAFAQIDGKSSGTSFHGCDADRAYIASTLKEAAQAVDAAIKPEKKPLPSFAKAPQSAPNRSTDWPGG